MRTIALVAAVLVSTAALADTTTRYTVLFQDRPGGSQVTTVRADGRIDVDMSYRNNGRGPDIKERSRFAPDGTLVSFQVSGKSTFGAPISERYALHGNQAQWRSVADHGEATVTAPAVYVPVDSSFEAFAVIVRAALRQRENRIAALPGVRQRVAVLLCVRQPVAVAADQRGAAVGDPEPCRPEQVLSGEPRCVRSPRSIPRLAALRHPPGGGPAGATVRGGSGVVTAGSACSAAC